MMRFAAAGLQSGSGGPGKKASRREERLRLERLRARLLLLNRHRFPGKAGTQEDRNPGKKKGVNESEE
jgi:hypothetical protein